MKIVILASAVSTLLANVPAARANYQSFGGIVSGFGGDTATSDYLAAQGTPTEYVSFAALAADGTGPFVQNVVDGSSFSSGVSFASLNQTSVSYYSNGAAAAEIGPTDAGSWTGTLIVTLASAASAVGIGTVDPLQVSFFDSHGNDVGNISTSNTFEFVGLVGADGSDIKTIDITGNFIAIQDFQYATAAVPEPASIALLAVGFAGVSLIRRRNGS